MSTKAPNRRIAIGCGGTGGHLFPGIAVGEVLYDRGWEVMLLISSKEVDQTGVRGLQGPRVETLPAVGFDRGRIGGFVKGLVSSLKISARLFREFTPGAVLSMGGFTSVPPVLAGWRRGVPCFVHEANSIPGKANRWMAHLAEECFVFFPETAGRLWNQRVTVTGMPVRRQFQGLEAAGCRTMLGLDSARPVLLVVGGSQGATGINQLVVQALPSLKVVAPDLQFIHLTGPQDHARVAEVYRGLGVRAVVRPFLTEMELALGAATVAISRSGASSLAEMAAVGLPSILVPYPAATDNHQFYNARAFVETGAARQVDQKTVETSEVVRHVQALLRDQGVRAGMVSALSAWGRADAAEAIGDAIERHLGVTPSASPSKSGGSRGADEETGPMPMPMLRRPTSAQPTKVLGK